MAKGFGVVQQPLCRDVACNVSTMVPKVLIDVSTAIYQREEERGEHDLTTCRGDPLPSIHNTRPFNSVGSPFIQTTSSMG